MMQKFLFAYMISYMIFDLCSNEGYLIKKEIGHIESMQQKSFLTSYYRKYNLPIA